MTGREQKDLRQGLLDAGTITQDILDFMRAFAERRTSTRPSDIADDPDDLVQEAFLRSGPGGMLRAAHSSVDDTQFRGYLRKLVRREDADRRRDTPRGRVIKSIEDAMREAKSRFERHGTRWCLPETKHNPSPIRRRTLDDAAARVPITPVTSPGSDVRNPPIAPREEERKLCEAVLQAANGCLEKGDLAEVVAARVGLTISRSGLTLDDLEDWNGIADPTASAEAIGDDEIVAQILAELDEAEVMLLAAILIDNLTVREAGTRLNLGRSTISERTNRLTLKLRRILNQLDADIDADSLRHAIKHQLGQLGDLHRSEEA